MARRAASRSDDRHGATQPVECARCGAIADVVKFSPQHTSVQWTADAAGRCTEFRDRAAEGTLSALVEGCAALRDSIDAAVASGRLAVLPPQYEQAQYEQAQYEQAQYEQAQYEQAQYEQAQYEQAQYEQADNSARRLPGNRGGGDPRD
jgi:hypothetical protein